jgi:hypothetical protein
MSFLVTTRTKPTFSQPLIRVLIVSDPRSDQADGEMAIGGILEDGNGILSRGVGALCTSQSSESSMQLGRPEDVYIIYPLSDFS